MTDAPLKDNRGATLFRHSRRMRDALLHADLDRAEAAHRAFRDAFAAAFGSAPFSESERRWGNLAERMLGRCQRLIAVAQSGVAAELELLDGGQRGASSYSRS